MTNTQQEKLEHLFVQMNYGIAYITKSKTNLISGGETTHEFNTLDVKWSVTGRATKFYSIVLPKLEKAGYRVIDLQVNDQDGKTIATFKVDSE